MKELLLKMMPSGRGMLLLVVFSVLGGGTFTLSRFLLAGDGYLTASFFQIVLFGFCAIFLTAVFLIASDFLYVFINNRQVKKSKKRNLLGLTLSKLSPSMSKSSIIKHSVLLFLLWSPWFIALYPGAMNWDTYYQITMCYPDMYKVWLIPWSATNTVVDYTFSDHHPFFDTLIFGFFARSSDFLFQSWNQGVFLYVIIQSLLLAIIIVYFLAYLEKCWQIPKLSCAVTYLFFALFPIVPLFAGAMLKDSIHLLALLPFLLMFFEIVRTQGSVLQSLKFLVVFIVICCLVCLTKKTGFYFIAICLLLLAITM